MHDPNLGSNTLELKELMDEAIDYAKQAELLDGHVHSHLVGLGSLAEV